MRPSKQEIKDKLKSLAEELGRTPGQALFTKRTRIGTTDCQFVGYPAYRAVVEDAGLKPNSMCQEIPEADVFESYAKACIRWGKVPSDGELRIAIRELGLKNRHIYASERFGHSIVTFRKAFRKWLENNNRGYREILTYPGWEIRQTVARKESKPSKQSRLDLELDHPFLPAILHSLDKIEPAEGSSNDFEQRCSAAFQSLGFEVKRLGQGRGRVADFWAISRRHGFGVIVDAKRWSDRYKLGTEDRKFREYVETHSKELHDQGVDEIYFAVISSRFDETDLTKLRRFLSHSAIVRSVAFFTTAGLIKLVEHSIENRHTFDISETKRLLFGNEIINESCIAKNLASSGRG